MDWLKANRWYVGGVAGMVAGGAMTIYGGLVPFGVLVLVAGCWIAMVAAVTGR